MPGDDLRTRGRRRLADQNAIAKFRPELESYITSGQKTTMSPALAGTH